MAFYLVCTVILCIRAAKSLHQNGQSMVEYRTEIDVDQAHQKNKEYMFRANKTLLQVRHKQWKYQYWLLILSMIIMYPTPLLPDLKTKLPDQAEKIDQAIFWMFWGGVYITPDGKNSSFSTVPLYLILIVLIIEKQAQRWLLNRFGCTFQRVQEFKTLDEQKRLIRRQMSPDQVNQDSKIARVVPLSDCPTIGEAKQECDLIQSLYRPQTPEVEEKRIKETLIRGITRKYSIQLRTGMKVIMEQTSLLLLLLSCAFKSNILSVLYLFVLMTFLLIKNKTTGMLIMSYTFGITLALEYTNMLTNLTSLNSPIKFPPEFSPYPSTQEPQGTFIVPWYLKVDFLTKDLAWTYFFAFDIEQSSINDIWFDFANLALLTVYFFSFGNPINSKNIKVSFSRTKRLEDALDQYSKIQMKKKVMVKRSEQHIIDEENQNADTSNDEDLLEQAADNSLEFFLGATCYLQELKQSLFLYQFTKKARYFVFIGWQIVTVIMVFVIALLCKSLMSLGYMIACVPLILNITDFFKLEQLQQQGKSWRHPKVICGPLMFYSFFDIAAQLVFQAPFNSGDSYWQNQFGFHKIWTVKQVSSFQAALQHEGSLALMDSQSLVFLILKSFNLFFIFLQSRIYESDSFYKFMRNERRRLMSLAKNYKRQAITYRFNNWKIQKIVGLQQKKLSIYKGVAELKMKLQIWQRLVGLTSLQQTTYVHESMPASTVNATRQTPLLEKPEEDAQVIKHNQEGEQNPLRSQSPSAFSQTMKSKVLPHLDKRITSYELSQKKTGRMPLLQLEVEKDELFFVRKLLLKDMTKKLPALARLYIWLKKKHINQVVFITDMEEAQNVKKAMEQGKRRIYCDLEQTMLKDINLYLARANNNIKIFPSLNNSKKYNKLDESEQLKLEDMSKTFEQVQLRKVISSLFFATQEFLFCNLSFIAYFFMIMSQIFNAGLISIAYPFAVFGYALMEEVRPGKGFWIVMIKYTLFILFMKFIVQLDVWLAYPDTLSSMSYLSDWVLFGLWRVDGVGSLLLCVFPELIILAAIMGQCYFETLIGLHEKKEVEVEDIVQAKQRFLYAMQSGAHNTHKTIKAQKKEKLQRFEEDCGNVDEEGLSYEERLAYYNIDLGASREQVEKEMAKVKEFDQYIRNSHLMLRANQELLDDMQDYLPERRFSHIDDQIQRRLIGKELKQKRQKTKTVDFIKKHFSKSPYFRKLFPVVKQQKPGKDLYALITATQFLICVYLVQLYTSMDADGTQNLDSSSQFSFHMVLVLFFQVLVMILERYINRTNTKITVKKVGKHKPELEESKNLDEKYMAKMQGDEGPRSMSIHIEPAKSKDTQLIQHHNSRVGSVEIKEDQPKITLEQTRMTAQQVIKYCLQWFLLIIYHALIFWVFPLNSNFAIYGSPRCLTESGQYGKYGCMSFHQNAVLIIFYLIFCVYFALSALQIRHGLPDFRRGSSLMQKYHKGYQITYQIFVSMPFLLELKTILDWCFTKTALDLDQWLQLAQINFEMFHAKCVNMSYFGKKFGEAIDKVEKWICGCFCLSVILFFLVGPFLMFSNLSFIADENLVTGQSMSFTIKIDDIQLLEAYEFPIFKTTSPVMIMTLNETQFVNSRFDTIPETKFFEFNQVQYIKAKNASETAWSLSTEYIKKFRQLINRAAEGDSSVRMHLHFSYEFTRPGPQMARKAYGTNLRNLDSNDTEDLDIIKQFQRTSQMPCSTQKDATEHITIQDFLNTKIRLTEKSTIEQLPFPPDDLILSYSCENYWAININNKGIVFTTFSDLISSGFLSATSIMGFYIGVAFLVGTNLRKIAIYTSDRVFIKDAPNPDAIINLCSCIYMQRLEQNLKKEEELYYVLMEVVRSPEIMKAITGSSTRTKTDTSNQH